LEKAQVVLKYINSHFKNIWIGYVGIDYFLTILLTNNSVNILKKLKTIIFDEKTKVILFITVIYIILVIIEKVLHKINKYNSINRKFSTFLKEHTADELKGLENSTGISLGKNKVMIVCPNIIDGWKLSNIKLNKSDCFDTNKYIFEENNELWKDIKTDYELFKFEHDKDAIKVENNCERIMLNSFVKTKKENLYLNFKICDYSQTSFIWDKMRKDNILKKRYIKKMISSSKVEYLPNSFCLHLIVETKDKKIILSKISTMKKNDYSETIAATIGEQLEKSDIYKDGNIDYNENFVENWLKRAFFEEFGFNEFECVQYVDFDSSRILSVNLEADIVNYSMVCVTKLLFNEKEFKERIVSKPMDNTEVSNIEFISRKDIPKILCKINSEDEKKYHPSTFLRLLLFLMHKEGYKRTWKLINKENKRKPNPPRSPYEPKTNFKTPKK